VKTAYLIAVRLRISLIPDHLSDWVVDEKIKGNNQEDTWLKHWFHYCHSSVNKSANCIYLPELLVIVGTAAIPDVKTRLFANQEHCFTKSCNFMEMSIVLQKC